MFRCLIDGRPLTLLLRRSVRGWLAHFRNIFTPRFFTWIRHYNLKFLLADLLSALVITSIVIPQALAYAVIAGQQPVYGLYANLVGPVFYTLYGTGVHTIVGALALMAIMVSNVAKTVDPTAVPGTPLFNELTVLVCLVMGTMRMLCGILRFGFIADFISVPVLSSFVTGAGIVIVESQLRALLGLQCLDSATGCGSKTRLAHTLVEATPRIAGNDVFVDLAQIFENLGHAHWPTVLLSALCIAVLLLAQNKRVPRWMPSILILMIVVTLISFLADFEKFGIAVVGVVPSGLPKPSLPVWSWSLISSMLPGCAVVAFVGYVGDIALGRQMGALHGYKIDNNIEWMASGLSNVTAIFFGGGVPVSASYSRTAVNSQCGGKTQMVNTYVALLVMLTLLVLTPTFKPLPEAVLAAVVIVACKSLLSFGDLISLWKSSIAEFFIWLGTFFATVTFGVQNGILIGMAISLFYFVIEMALTGPILLDTLSSPRVHFTDRRKLNNEATSSSESTSNAASLNDADDERRSRVIVVGFTGPLYFGNSGRLYDYISQCAEKRPVDEDDALHSEMSRRRVNEAEPLLSAPISSVIDRDTRRPLALLIDFERVSSIDVTAAKLILEALTAFFAIKASSNASNIKSRPSVAIFGLSRRMRSLLERNGLVSAVGEEHFHSNVDNALQYVLNQCDQES